MRVVGLLVVALAVVSATQQALEPELLKDIASSKFGESILLELAESEEAAPSLQALLDLVDQIEKRIQDAEDADYARNARRQAICEDDLLSLKQKQNNTIKAIKVIQGQIAETSTQIGRLTRAIGIMEDRIVEDRLHLHDTRVMLGNNTRMRFMDEAIYNQRLMDTEAAQEAVAQILALDWSLLISRQDDRAENHADQTLDTAHEEGLHDVRNGPQYDHTGDYGQSMAAFIQKKFNKAASTMKDETARNFLQVASVAVQGLSEANVDQLKDLLERLAQELADYETDLRTEETAAKAAWEAQEKSLREQIATQEIVLEDDIAEKVRLIDHRAYAEDALQEYQLKWSGLKEQYTGNPDAPGALEILIAATEHECTHWQEEFERRSKTRNDELGTVTKIKEIIANRTTNYRTADTEKFTTNGLDSNGDFGTTPPARTSYP
jgi:hypothetical protein